jgi:preprotein translocase subunit SecE
MAKAVAVLDNNDDGMQRLKSGPARLRTFLEDVRNETKKLSTPTSAEVKSTTIVVLVTVFVFAAYFAVVDYIASHTVGALLEKLTQH